MTASAGTAKNSNSFYYWAYFTNENGKTVRLSKYISKSGLWEDMKAAGATSQQMKEAKEAMKKAPTKKMYI